MLFTWDTTNLCIVFEKWHVYSTAGLLFSLLAVVLIGMGYEALRAGTRRYEVVMSRRIDNVPSESRSLSLSLSSDILHIYTQPPAILPKSSQVKSTRSGKMGPAAGGKGGGKRGNG